MKHSISKILLPLLFLAVFIPDSWAQKGGFGLKGGVGLSTLGIENENSNNPNNKFKVGGMLGMSYEIVLGDGPFAIDIEALIANKGNRFEDRITLGGQTAASLELTNNIFTVDVPISGKVYLGDNFNILVGPYFSYIFGGRINAKSTIGSNTNTSESSDVFSDDLRDSEGRAMLNRIDMGINVGLEFVSNGGFGFGARLNQGFTSVINKDYNKELVNQLNLNPSSRAFNTTLQLYGLIRF